MFVITEFDCNVIGNGNVYESKTYLKAIRKPKAIFE